jgi:hypothetical protein
VQEARYLDRADQRPASRIHPATAVRGHDHVGCEQLGEPGEVTALQRLAQLGEHRPASVGR